MLRRIMKHVTDQNWLVSSIGLVVCIVLILQHRTAVSQDIDERIAFMTTLFTGAEQYQNFHRLAEIFPSNVMKAGTSPNKFPIGETISLPSSYDFAGKSRETNVFLEETDTAALVVIADGDVRYENYWLSGGPDVHWMSFSVGKSFVSALIGIALDEGHITSIEDPITDYVPSLNGSAYEGVRIKDILQMSSGARWNEDYSDPESDIAGYIRTLAGNGSLNEFTATLEKEREPGTAYLYNSTDTQALGMLLIAATGQSMASFAEEKLWKPLGMEEDGYWNTDEEGIEAAAGGLQVTARDYAKFGQLYLNMGRWQDKQIVPSEWVRASVTPGAPHLMSGELYPGSPL
ncbi:MAG: serine hydrolase [Emcibacteraceae bacterium]|nr:serine hydrolase [Emcibacteraceae bacterium]